MSTRVTVVGSREGENTSLWALIRRRRPYDKRRESRGGGISPALDAGAQGLEQAERQDVADPGEGEAPVGGVLGLPDHPQGFSSLPGGDEGSGHGDVVADGIGAGSGASELVGLDADPLGAVAGEDRGRRCDGEVVAHVVAFDRDARVVHHVTVAHDADLPLLLTLALELALALLLALAVGVVHRVAHVVADVGPVQGGSPGRRVAGAQVHVAVQVARVAGADHVGVAAVAALVVGRVGDVVAAVSAAGVVVAGGEGGRGEAEGEDDPEGQEGEGELAHGGFLSGHEGFGVSRGHLVLGIGEELLEIGEVFEGRRLPADEAIEARIASWATHAGDPVHIGLVA